MKRREDIDALKAIGIILMIACHIDFGPTADSLIHSFHMPLFFFISGYLYRDVSEFKPYLLNKARSLLIPYVIFGILHMIIKFPMLLHEQFGIENALYHLILFNHDGIPIAGALWFLTSLFGTSIIFFYINKFKTKILTIIAVLIISTIGTLLPYWGIRLPWSLDISCAMLLVFYIAYLFKDQITSILSNTSYAFLCILIAIILWYFNDDVNVREARYGNVFMFYACAILFTFGLFIISNKLVRKQFKAKKYFLSIGTSSLIFMAFNQLVVWLPNKYYRYDYSILGYSVKIMELGVTLFVLYWISILFEKSKLWRKLIKGHVIHKN